MKKTFVFILAFVLFLSTGGHAKAETLHFEISGNGNESQNTAATAITEQTSINQTNDAEISNEVTIDTNTGENGTNDNSSNHTEIQTGDIEAQAQIENQFNSF